jgi:hypothetical protein
MPTPSWRTDTSRHPLVIVHLVGGDGSEQADSQSLIRIVDGLIEKRERVVVVYDLTGSKPDAKRRQLLVQWLSENAEKLARYVVASGIVAPTAFHRGLLIATFWFVKPKAPVELFGDRTSAVSWAVTRGKDAGLDWPKQ